MPDWKDRLHRTFEANGHACDVDVLEELSSHAATAYEALRADGCDPNEAERRVGDLIDVWVREAADLHRAPKRPPRFRRGPPISPCSQA